MKKISLSKVVCIAFAFCAAAAIASPAQTLTTLVAFDYSNGSDPAAPLIQGSDGNLYGTTQYGGTASNCEEGLPCGTVFKITTSGTLATLHNFDYGDGAFPVSPLVQGTDGNFYGTNQGEADSGGAGTIFKITPGGTLTVLLYSFSSPAGLVQGRDGNFYGTTPRSYTDGTVFKVTPSGTLTTLYTFTGTDGNNPQAGLILATDGNFYGTTFSGGTSTYCGGGCGTVFKITPGGSLTTLHSFSGPDGFNVQAGLVEGADGNFYGTTVNGGGHGVGEVFQITPSCALTVLYSFCSQTGCTDGNYPKAALMQATDGNFYGTTSAGGTYGQGTVFAITPNGSLTTLYSFCAQTGCADGATPIAGVIQASDGNFYGTTYNGGNNNSGTVFRMPLPVLTTTGLTSTPDPSYMGQAVTLTATVTAQNGSTPTGTVVFQSNGTQIGSASLNGSGVAVLVYSGWGLGSYNLTAVYQGSGNLVGSTSNTVVQVVEISPTTTVLTSKPNPSYLKQPVTLTATVTAQNGSTPTGTVMFNSNGTQIGSASLNNSGVAILVYSAWGLGSYNLTAVYQGSGTLAGSTSNTVVQVVGGTTTSVTSAPNPSTVGQQVTITATVGGASGGPLPTGTVSFTSNGAAIAGCTAVPLPSSLTVVCMTSALAVGTDAIVAAYSGDSNYLGSSGTLTQIVNPVPSPVQFVPVTPCRLMDTRTKYGGGGPIQGGTFQTFDLPELAQESKGCPTLDLSSAVGYSLNVTVVPGAPMGYLTIWPTGEGQPIVSTMNSPDGRVKANAAIVPAGTSASVNVFASNTADVLLDIDGYFATPSPSTLAFYPLPPCRVADTRYPSSDGLGAPYLTGGQKRDFPILNATSCNIPNSALAYSLNFTAVPHGSLGYLTVWPTGGSQPVVSTLNAPTGTVVANAAIVPTTNGGEISAFASNDTDQLIDINGYFAASGGQNALSLYPVTPCRVIDTRHSGNGQPFSGERTVDVVDSVCAPPSTAQAYVFNATVVPSGSLGYLTLWPDCPTCQRPVVSTLNAQDGAITSNMAIVPNSDGSTDAFASNLTQLILDISSYFAP